MDLGSEHAGQSWPERYADHQDQGTGSTDLPGSLWPLSPRTSRPVAVSVTESLDTEEHCSSSAWDRRGRSVSPVTPSDTRPGTPSDTRPESPGLCASAVCPGENAPLAETCKTPGDAEPDTSMDRGDREAAMERLRALAHRVFEASGSLGSAETRDSDLEETRIALYRRFRHLCTVWPRGHHVRDLEAQCRTLASEMEEWLATHRVAKAKAQTLGGRMDRTKETRQPGEPSALAGHVAKSAAVPAALRPMETKERGAADLGVPRGPGSTTAGRGQAPRVWGGELTRSPGPYWEPLIPVSRPGHPDLPMGTVDVGRDGRQWCVVASWERRRWWVPGEWRTPAQREDVALGLGPNGAFIPGEWRCWNPCVQDPGLRRRLFTLAVGTVHVPAASAFSPARLCDPKMRRPETAAASRASGASHASPRCARPATAVPPTRMSPLGPSVPSVSVPGPKAETVRALSAQWSVSPFGIGSSSSSASKSHSSLAPTDSLRAPFGSSTVSRAPSVVNPSTVPMGRGFWVQGDRDSQPTWTEHRAADVPGPKVVEYPTTTDTAEDRRSSEQWRDTYHVISRGGGKVAGRNTEPEAKRAVRVLGKAGSAKDPDQPRDAWGPRGTAPQPAATKRPKTPPRTPPRPSSSAPSLASPPLSQETAVMYRARSYVQGSVQAPRSLDSAAVAVAAAVPGGLRGQRGSATAAGSLRPAVSVSVATAPTAATASATASATAAATASRVPLMSTAPTVPITPMSRDPLPRSVSSPPMGPTPKSLLGWSEGPGAGVPGSVTHATSSARSPPSSLGTAPTPLSWMPSASPVYPRSAVPDSPPESLAQPALLEAAAPRRWTLVEMEVPQGVWHLVPGQRGVQVPVSDGATGARPLLSEPAWAHLAFPDVERLWILPTTTDGNCMYDAVAQIRSLHSRRPTKASEMRRLVVQQVNAQNVDWFLSAESDARLSHGSAGSRSSGGSGGYTWTPESVAGEPSAERRAAALRSALGRDGTWASETELQLLVESAEFRGGGIVILRSGGHVLPRCIRARSRDRGSGGRSGAAFRTSETKDEKQEDEQSLQWVAVLYNVDNVHWEALGVAEPGVPGFRTVFPLASLPEALRCILRSSQRGFTAADRFVKIPEQPGDPPLCVRDSRRHDPVRWAPASCIGVLAPRRLWNQDRQTVLRTFWTSLDRALRSVSAAVHMVSEAGRAAHIVLMGAATPVDPVIAVLGRQEVTIRYSARPIGASAL